MCVGGVVKGLSCGVPVDVASRRRAILPVIASVSQQALYQLVLGINKYLENCFWPMFAVCASSELCLSDVPC